MNSRLKQIGIDRFIRIEWLEQVSSLVAAGNDEKTTSEALEHFLTNLFPSSSSTKRGALSKTHTILLKTWSRVPQDIYYLRENGLELLQANDKTCHLAIHWGMIMAAYPFWGAVAGQTGRLLGLQGDFVASQVQRRIREKYGERQTVSRAAQRAIQSFADWGVLKENKESRIYSPGQTYPIDDPEVISWLVEASLHARSNGSAAIKDLLDSASLFPFHLAHLSAERLVSLSPRLDLLRHGLDDDLVMLR